MYHIITNLELMFDSLEEARQWVNSPHKFEPRVPLTAMKGEDIVTKRICVSPSIENCITALGASSLFRRCLNANKDTKSYENDDEAYPIIVVAFDNGLDYIEPTKDQVPDVDITNEMWLLQSEYPVNMEIKWLGAYSVIIREDKHSRTICKSVKFVDNLTGYHHPWLDGCGHPLDSSYMGDEPCKNIELAPNQIYYTNHMGGKIGFAMPVWPPDGRCWFQPLDADAGKIYKVFAHSLTRFTGLYDALKRPIFESTLVKYTPNPNDYDLLAQPIIEIALTRRAAENPKAIGKQEVIGEIVCIDNDKWGLRPMCRNEAMAIPISSEGKIAKNIKLLAGYNPVVIPKQFDPPN